LVDDSRIVLGFEGHLRFFKPDGTEVARLSGNAVVKAGADLVKRSYTLGDLLDGSTPQPAAETFGPCGRAARDGRLPLETRLGLCLLTPGTPPGVTPVKSAKGDHALFASGDVPKIVAWSPDGKRAIGCWRRQSLFKGPSYEYVRIDLEHGTTSELAMPKNRKVADWSADGWFLAIDEELGGYFEGWGMKSQTLCKVSADGKTSETLAAYAFDGDWSRPTEFLNDGCSSNVVALSPDGKRVACLVTSSAVYREGKRAEPLLGIKICVMDLASKKQTVVFEEPGKRVGDATFSDIPHGIRWSPDGTRIGFLLNHWDAGKEIITSWRVGVVGADGHGAKTVYASDKTEPKAPLLPLTLFDWR
jgi:dipeptidyl aminopeptidase/acylaminoacyl peptidase